MKSSIDDNFLRYPPNGLIPKQAILFQSLQHSIDGIELSFLEIRKILSEIVNEDSSDNKNKGEIRGWKNHSGLFIYSWSVIHYSYVMGTILKSLEKNKIKTNIGSEYISKTVDSSKMRNCLFHIENSVNNLINNKKIQQPLFGVFAFSRNNLNKNDEYIHCITPSGVLPNSKQSMAREPKGRKYIRDKFGGISLTAFDRVANIDDIYLTALEVKEFFNSSIKDEVHKMILRDLSDKPLEAEMSLKQRADGMWVDFYITGSIENE